MTTNSPPIVPDLTGNRLQEFDLALSLSLNAVNIQLADAWDVWCPPGAQFNIIKLQDAIAGVRAIALGVPTMALAPSGDPGEVEISFPFSAIAPSGTNPTPIGQSDWKLAYSARLLQRKLEEAQLARLDHSSAEGVARIIDQAGRDDGQFSIESLFVDFTTLRRVAAAPLSCDPGIVGAVTRAVFKITDGTQVLLQTVVCPRTAKRPASFMLKDFAFKLTRSKDPARASTIDYLGVFHGQRDLPDAASLDGARTRLDSWLDLARSSGKPSADGELVAGVMAIRGQLFQAKVMEGLRKALDARYAYMAGQNEKSRAEHRIANPAIDLAYPEAELFKEMRIEVSEQGFVVRENLDHNHYTWQDGGVECKLVKRLELRFEPLPGGGYRIGGKISADYSRETKGFLGSTASCTTEASITGSMALAAHTARDQKRAPIGANIVPALDLRVGEFKENKSANLLTILTGSLVALVQQIVTSAYARDARQAIGKTLSEAAGQINIGLAALPVVLPGEEVFTFKTPRFTRAHDLMLDVVYRATRPQADPASTKPGGRP